MEILYDTIKHQVFVSVKERVYCMLLGRESEQQEKRVSACKCEQNLGLGGGVHVYCADVLVVPAGINTAKTLRLFE